MAPSTTIRRGQLTELLTPNFVAALDRLDVMSRKILAGKLQGEKRSKRRGQSVEFADHRPYVVGDDLRFIDWNIYGRLNQLFLKLFMEEQDLTVHLLVDTSESTGFGQPPKSDLIRRLAAALGYVSIVNNNRVTVSTFGQGLTGQLANLRGRQRVADLASFLLQAQPSGPSDFSLACRQIASGRIGKGLMVVLSDFLLKEGYADGLRRLLGRQYDLYCVQVLSGEELEPTLQGELKLQDLEDADEAEVTINPAMLDYYHKVVRAYCDDLEQFCTRRGGVYLFARSDADVEAFVLQHLRKIGLLK